MLEKHEIASRRSRSVLYTSSSSTVTAVCAGTGSTVGSTSTTGEGNLFALPILRLDRFKMDFSKGFKSSISFDFRGICSSLEMTQSASVRSRNGTDTPFLCLDRSEGRMMARPWG